MRGRSAVLALLVAAPLIVVGSVDAASVGVVVGNYYFEDGSVGDGRIEATVGDQLRFTVVEGAGHTVTIDALGIDSGQLAPGAVFTTPRLGTAGNYTVICRTHIARNHTTTLVVRPAATTATTQPRPAGSTTTIAGTPPVGTASGSDGFAAPTTNFGDSPVSSPYGSAPSDSTSQGTPSEGTSDLPGPGEYFEPGAVEGERLWWLQSVWAGVALFPVIGAVVVLAIWLGERHQRARRRID